VGRRNEDRTKKELFVRLDENREELNWYEAPDPTFQARRRLAMEAPRRASYTLLLSPDFSKPTAFAGRRRTARFTDYSQSSTTVTMPNTGDEFHHSAGTACS